MKNNKSVIIWLLSGCILLFIMVMVGGITRLTNSGLSMTDWHLVTDTFPPVVPNVALILLVVDEPVPLGNVQA